MDINALSGEKLVAFTALLREHDLNNRNFRVGRLFAASACRAFWSDWKKWDADDPDGIIDGAGDYHRTDGFPELGGSEDVILRRKWACRAALWTGWYYHEVSHVKDWLHVSVAADADWLSNVDAFGNPKKLMKCGSIDRLSAEATKWFDAIDHRNRSSGSQRNPIELGPKDETLECDLGAGYRLVRLLTPRALDRESRLMGHCIGHGSYDHLLADPSVKLLSVRDEDFKPRATLDVRSVNAREYLVQFRGHRNAKPEEHLVDLVSPLGYGSIREWYENKEWKTDAPGVNPRYVGF